MTNLDAGPDWVVLGTPTADGKVAVYASKDLTFAELVAERETDPWEYDLWSAARRLPPPLRIELKVGMRTYVVVFGDTYEEAFRTLFNEWSPTAAERPAIAAEPPAVEARVSRPDTRHNAT